MSIENRLKNSQSQFQKNWIKKRAKITKKQLLIQGFQVMQSWEDNYMKRLAHIVTQGGGDILELGFGLGISANYIQSSKKINSHTIIECHPDVMRCALQKFKEKIATGRVTLINGFWEHVTSKLKDNSFDGILLDTSPLHQETVFFHFFPFFNEAHRLLKNGGIFTYFSDEPRKVSKIHIQKLQKAGFKKINYEICSVNPPKDCRYWNHNTIVAPIVFK